jgi:hypothetical protein
MAQHGYLGDGYGTHGEIEPGGDNDYDRRPRDRDRDRYRERGEQWSGPDEDRDRNFFFDRFRDERGEQRWPEDRWPEQRGRADSYNRQSEDWSGQHRRASANPDDHYRSWRDRHMSELDRDYQDYCREREHQFHRDFDDWRRNRSQSGTGQRGSQEALELTEARRSEELSGSDGMAAATLGSVNAENEEKGRGGGRAKP